MSVHVTLAKVVQMTFSFLENSQGNVRRREQKENSAYYGSTEFSII